MEHKDTKAQSFIVRKTVPTWKVTKLAASQSLCTSNCDTFVNSATDFVSSCLCVQLIPKAREEILEALEKILEPPEKTPEAPQNIIDI